MTIRATFVTVSVMQVNGAALRIIRERTGFSLKQLSDDTGISASHLSRLETGVRRGTPSQIRTIAQILKVPIVAIIDAPATEREAS